MFNFAWSEFALIAVVALIAIGPKDMPVAIRAVTSWIKKARRMAAEFQTHVDEMMREADLHEVRASIDEIRNFDIKSEVERTIDADGSIRATFAENPLEPAASTVAETSVEEIAICEPAAAAPVAPEEPETDRRPSVPQAPAFVPPNMIGSPSTASAEAPEPPAFIPPDAALRRRSVPSA